MLGQLLRSLLQNPRNIPEVALEVRPAMHTALLCLKFRNNFSVVATRELTKNDSTTKTFILVIMWCDMWGPDPPLEGESKAMPHDQKAREGFLLGAKKKPINRKHINIFLAALVGQSSQGRTPTRPNTKWRSYCGIQQKTAG